MVLAHELGPQANAVTKILLPPVLGFRNSLSVQLHRQREALGRRLSRQVRRIRMTLFAFSAGCPNLGLVGSSSRPLVREDDASRRATDSSAENPARTILFATDTDGISARPPDTPARYRRKTARFMRFGWLSCSGSSSSELDHARKSSRLLATR